MGQINKRNLRLRKQQNSPPSVVTRRWAKIDIHPESLREPHAEVVVAKKRFRGVTLEKCYHVSSGVVEQPSRSFQTGPTDIVIAEMIGPDCGSEIGTRVNLAAIVYAFDKEDLRLSGKHNKNNKKIAGNSQYKNFMDTLSKVFEFGV